MHSCSLWTSTKELLPRKCFHFMVNAFSGLCWARLCELVKVSFDCRTSHNAAQTPPKVEERGRARVAKLLYMSLSIEAAANLYRMTDHEQIRFGYGTNNDFFPPIQASRC